MASSDVSSKLKNLKLDENRDINILLLGETGVGKSTFINSIANYLHFKSFKKAEKNDLLILIPSTITVTNEHYETVAVKVGFDQNEHQETGASATQDVKTYVFPIGGGNTRLRLIDTPGMGDTRGVQQDDINCENILAYLAQMKELHAICFLLKPTNARITVLFEYCVKQILSRLEKSASKNLIFIFTNSRGNDYGPGDTLPCLQKIVDQIKNNSPNVDIPLKDNIFCLDNEAFRYLTASKNNVIFHDHVKERYVESWKKSSKECWKLISYILGDTAHEPLKPHQLANTMSINEARRLVVQLSQPLADISQLIFDNLSLLDRHQYQLKVENQSLKQLKEKLYMPVVNLEVIKLTQPVTVCASSKCAEIYKVGDVNKWHYRQRCHDPCFLSNIQKELIGDPGLVHCAAMGGSKTCIKCTCDYSVHMHVYYMTKTVDDRIVDNVVQNSITDKSKALLEVKRLVKEMDQRKKELEEERQYIVTASAQFAHFLQNNAITPFNDSYKSYIKMLIMREQSLGASAHVDVIKNLECLLKQYEETKAAFDASLKLSQLPGASSLVTNVVNAQSVIDCIHRLYKLKHNGKKIHELLKTQKASRNLEHDKQCEYIHPTVTAPSSKDENDKKKEESKKGENKKRDGNESTQGKRIFYNKRHTDSTPRGAPPPYQAHTHNPPNSVRTGSGYVLPSRRFDDSNLTVKVEVNPHNSYGPPPPPPGYDYPPYSHTAAPLHYASNYNSQHPEPYYAPHHPPPYYASQDPASYYAPRHPEHYYASQQGSYRGSHHGPGYQASPESYEASGVPYRGPPQRGANHQPRHYHQQNVVRTQRGGSGRGRGGQQRSKSRQRSKSQPRPRESFDSDSD